MVLLQSPRVSLDLSDIRTRLRQQMSPSRRGSKRLVFRQIDEPRGLSGAGFEMRVVSDETERQPSQKQFPLSGRHLRLLEW